MTHPWDDELWIEPERYELFEKPRYHFEPDRRDFLKLLGGGIRFSRHRRGGGEPERRS